MASIMVYIPPLPDDPPEEPKEPSIRVEEGLKKYLKDFSAHHNFVVGYFTELETLKEIKSMMEEKGYSFSVRDSDAKHRQKLKIKSKEEIAAEDPNNVGLNIFYQLKAMPINFFGLPFTIEKTTHYQCSYGCKYYKSKYEMGKQTFEFNGKHIKRRNVGSKKMGCLAKMTMKKVTVYDGYELDLESDWRKKKKLIEQLRAELVDNYDSVEKKVRYYLSVSNQSSHNHPPIFMIPKGKGRRSLKRGRRGKGEKPKKHKSNSGKIVYIDNVDEMNKAAALALNTFNIPPDPLAVESPQPKSLNLQDENFFHTLVKFPANHPTYSDVESDFKSNVIELEINEFEQAEENNSDQTVEIQYEYESSIQFLQSSFREQLKRLYTLSEQCINAPLLVKLSKSLEDVEINLTNDVNFGSI